MYLSENERPLHVNPCGNDARRFADSMHAKKTLVRRSQMARTVLRKLPQARNGQQIVASGFAQMLADSRGKFATFGDASLQSERTWTSALQGSCSPGRPRPGTVVSCLWHQNVTSAVRKTHHQAHDDEHQIVVPSGSLLAPKAGVPHEHFFLDGAEHDQDQSNRGQLL
jgi:hypothetical protein